jgi:hypothetical protein
MCTIHVFVCVCVCLFVFLFVFFFVRLLFFSHKTVVEIIFGSYGCDCVGSFGGID